MRIICKLERKKKKRLVLLCDLVVVIKGVDMLGFERLSLYYVFSRFLVNGILFVFKFKFLVLGGVMMVMRKNLIKEVFFLLSKYFLLYFVFF